MIAVFKMAAVDNTGFPTRLFFILGPNFLFFFSSTTLIINRFPCLPRGSVPLLQPLPFLFLLSSKDNTRFTYWTKLITGTNTTSWYSSLMPTILNQFPVTSSMLGPNINLGLVVLQAITKWVDHTITTYNLTFDFKSISFWTFTALKRFFGIIFRVLIIFNNNNNILLV